MFTWVLLYLFNVVWMYLRVCVCYVVYFILIHTLIFLFLKKCSYSWNCTLGGNAWGESYDWTEEQLPGGRCCHSKPLTGFPTGNKKGSSNEKACTLEHTHTQIHIFWTNVESVEFRAKRGEPFQSEKMPHLSGCTKLAVLKTPCPTVESPPTKREAILYWICQNKLALWKGIVHFK